VFKTFITLLYIFLVFDNLTQTHHHHHFWLAPLRVRSATRSQQPSEQVILSHIDYFSQCEIVGLKVI